MNKIEAWYWGNLQLLANQMPDSTITYDDEDCQWIAIDKFPLPRNVMQNRSRLFILTPGLDKPITQRPEAFYLDIGLKHRSGRHLDHVFNQGAAHGCVDLSDYGYAWFCLLLDRWRPSYDVVNGDNYATVVNTIFQQLNTL